MPLPQYVIEWLQGHRETAAVGGIGWVVITAKSGARTTLMFDEINSEPDDDKLFALISARCKEAIANPRTIEG